MVAYGNEYYTKENENYTGLKNFTPKKKKLNHNVCNHIRPLQSSNSHADSLLSYTELPFIINTEERSIRQNTGVCVWEWGGGGGRR